MMLLATSIHTTRKLKEDVTAMYPPARSPEGDDHGSTDIQFVRNLSRPHADHDLPSAGREYGPGHTQGLVHCTREES